MAKIRKWRRLEREQAQRRFEKHRRVNCLAEPGVHDFVVVLDNLKQTFNVGKIFRSGDALGVKEIHLIGIDYFELSPAKGSLKWVPAVFRDDFAGCHKDLAQAGYRFFVLDPEAEKSLFDVDLPKKSAFVFGHEEYGISFDRALYPDIQSVRIPQFGMVQSLNVSIAASVVMYEYVRRYAEPEMEQVESCRQRS